MQHVITKFRDVYKNNSKSESSAQNNVIAKPWIFINMWQKVDEATWRCEGGGERARRHNTELLWVHNGIHCWLAEVNQNKLWPYCKLSAIQYASRLRAFDKNRLLPLNVAMLHSVFGSFFSSSSFFFFFFSLSPKFLSATCFFRFAVCRYLFPGSLYRSASNGFCDCYLHSHQLISLYWI